MLVWLIMPGATAFTLMPSGPHSSAACFVSPTTAAFEAVYAEVPALGCAAAIEARLTIDPPPPSAGYAARLQ